MAKEPKEGLFFPAFGLGPWEQEFLQKFSLEYQLKVFTKLFL